MTTGTFSGEAFRVVNLCEDGLALVVRVGRR